MKWTSSIIVALLLALGPAACSDDNGGTEDQGQDPDVTDLQPDETVQDQPADEPGPEIAPDPDVEIEIIPDTPRDETTEPDGPPPDVIPGDGVVGDPCTVPTDCGGIPASSLQCLTDIMGFITFEGGYCTATCTTPAECGEGGNCVNIMVASYCLKQCEASSECRTEENYECAELPYISDGNTYCIPQFGGMDGIDI